MKTEKFGALKKLIYINIFENLLQYRKYKKKYDMKTRLKNKTELQLVIKQLTCRNWRRNYDLIDIKCHQSCILLLNFFLFTYPSPWTFGFII
jgi:hypothetical protein